MYLESSSSSSSSSFSFLFFFIFYFLLLLFLSSFIFEVHFCIQLVLQLGMNFDLARSESMILQVFPFNSEKKRGGVAVKLVSGLY